MPVGFATVTVPFSSIGSGRNIAPRTRHASVPAIAHTSHRQRLDGTRPVGNRMRTIGIRPAITKVQLLIHAAQSAAGNDPGSVTTAYVAYSAVAPPNRRPSPITRKSQPIGLWGTRLASTAPVIVYVATDSTINSVNGSPV
jgi:hypothetical protein